MMLWEEIIESLPWGIIVVSHDHQVVAFNSRALELFRRTPQSLLGCNCSEILGGSLCRHRCPVSDKIPWSEFEKISRVISITDSEGNVLLSERQTLPWYDKDHQVRGCIHLLKVPTPLPVRPQPQEMPDLSDFGLLGSSSPIHEISYLIRSVAPTTSTVLIQGETGTGKEIAAQIIHSLSGREKQPFVSLNCAALPENLIDSELFGHEKGAFTGADKENKGYFETAHRGTIFLDEIAETSLLFQAKLLRVLQSGEYQRLGSASPKKTDARIIAATNKDLVALVKNQKFREDLYYRLSVFPIKMPPLRDRPGDLSILVNFFIKDFAERMKKNIEGITEVALTLLYKYDFPGNVRELKNILEYAFIKCNDRLIGPTDLPRSIFDMGPQKLYQEEEFSSRKLLDVLEQCNQNKAKAARTLGISRKTLYRRLEKNKDDIKED